LNDGIHGTGFGFLAWSRVGVIISVFSPQVLSPFYDHPFWLSCIDTGTGQLIADGKIKLKSGPQIERFTDDAIPFDDGSELEADVVLFATGCADYTHPPLAIVNQLIGGIGWATAMHTSSASVALRLLRSAIPSGASRKKVKITMLGVT
jgi:hypothetical protein